MKEREPEHNESTDDAVWLDLVSRLENMPADETHGGRDAPGGSGAAGSGTNAGDKGPGSGPTPAGAALPPSADAGGQPPAGNATTSNAAPGTAASGEAGSGQAGSGQAASGTAASGEAAPDAAEGPKAAGRTREGADGGPAPRTPAERTRAIFENQPFRPLPPRGPRDYDEPEELESEGEFVPPEPPPFSTGEPLVVLAWIGTLGGPLLLLLFALFWRGAPVAIILGVIALFGAAAAYLLFRLPQHRDDDGAAV